MALAGRRLGVSGAGWARWARRARSLARRARDSGWPSISQKVGKETHSTKTVEASSVITANNKFRLLREGTIRGSPNCSSGVVAVRRRDQTGVHALDDLGYYDLLRSDSRWLAERSAGRILAAVALPAFGAGVQVVSLSGTVLARSLW